MTDNIITFPITKIDNFDFLTEKEIVYQLRLSAIELLNRLNTGEGYLPIGTDMEGLHTINALSVEYGFEPLDFTEIKCVKVPKIGYLSEE